jgi:hypothetical protein
VVDEAKVAERYRLLAPHLSKRELACWAAAEALVAGRCLANNRYFSLTARSSTIHSLFYADAPEPPPSEALN